nr:hypothetical protein BaRGS_034870 [Batillaria attramentaria]
MSVAGHVLGETSRRTRMTPECLAEFCGADATIPQLISVVYHALAPLLMPAHVTKGLVVLIASGRRGRDGPIVTSHAEVARAHVTARANRKKAGVAAKFNRTDEDIFNKDDDDIEVEKTKKSDDAVVTVDGQLGIRQIMLSIMRGNCKRQEKKKKEKTEKTKTDDDGTSAVIIKKGYPCQQRLFRGRGQVCSSRARAAFYLICTKHGVAREMKCPRHKYWDDKRKKCKKQSRTCKDRRG